MQKVRILTSFRDKDDFTKVYLTDSEVEFTKERAEYLKGLGLVGFDSKEVITTIGTVEMIDMNLPWQDIVSEVKKSDALPDLERALIFETNGKNRKSVIEALQTRIAELDAGNDDDELQTNNDE